MALVCNIDSKGKSVRLIYGILMILAGVAAGLGWGWAGHSTIGWCVSIFCLVGGAFGIFEARAGWCVVRAMGFKTPV